MQEAQKRLIQEELMPLLRELMESVENVTTGDQYRAINDFANKARVEILPKLEMPELGTYASERCGDKVNQDIRYVHFEFQKLLSIIHSHANDDQANNPIYSIIFACSNVTEIAINGPAYLLLNSMQAVGILKELFDEQA